MATQKGRLVLRLPNLNLRGGKHLILLTIISVIVEVASLVVGVFQLVLSLRLNPKRKKNRQ